MKGIGDEPIFSVSSIKGKARVISEDKENVVKNYEGVLKKDGLE